MNVINREHRLENYKSRGKSRKLCQILQNSHKGFAYELLQLQIALQDEASPTPRNKLQDITKLIELYMKGVQVLECFSDYRSRYFQGKLNNLMLKKTVFEELHKEADRKDLGVFQAKNKEEKQEKHQLQLMYTTENTRKAREKELQEAEKVLTGCQNIIRNGIKDQENSIKERIRQRKLRSENGSVKKQDRGLKRQSMGISAKINQYFSGQRQRVIHDGPNKRINFVTINDHYDARLWTQL